MKKLIRRVSAAVLSLAIVGGAMPYAPSLFKLPDFSLTAEAASGYSYDSTTQTLTLKGPFDLDDIRSYSTKAKKVVSTSSAVFPKSDWLFDGWAAEEYDLTLGDFSNVISLEQYFMNSKAKSIKIGNSTLKNATTMFSMFYGCSSLTYLELGPDGSAGSSAPDAWRTPKVTSCFNMFKDCTSLESLRINNFTLGENVRSDQMFSGLDSLVILYFGKTFEVTENMNLPNEYGWTAVGKNGLKVSGDGEYAVIAKPARYEQFISMKGYKFFNVAMPGVNNNYYYETIFLAGKPYPGNTVDNTIGSEGVHHSNYNYSIDEENTGWYDVDNGRFLENGEKFRFGGAYVFKIRYVPKANVSLTLPDMYNLSKINYFFVNKYGNLENYSLLNTAFANQNEDGSVDVYAVLRDKVNAMNYTADLTSNEKSARMDVPEDAVTVLATTNNQIIINRIPSLTISTSPACIEVEPSTLINDDYAYFNKNNVTLELSYTTVLGEKKTESIPFSQMKLSGYAAGEYEYDFLSVRAKDSCRPVTAKICENGRQISNANTYSIQTYAYNKLNKNTTSQKLRTIINALMVYCKSAENYFSA